LDFNADIKQVTFRKSNKFSGLGWTQKCEPWWFNCWADWMPSAACELDKIGPGG
jgi:hypothetical protein